MIDGINYIRFIQLFLLRILNVLFLLLPNVFLSVKLIETHDNQLPLWSI
jgi:hypothetical protein